ncbi:hypothetical protein HK405_013758, partial [Cladochytrium tenue]
MDENQPAPVPAAGATTSKPFRPRTSSLKPSFVPLPRTSSLAATAAVATAAPGSEWQLAFSKLGSTEQQQNQALLTPTNSSTPLMLSPGVELCVSPLATVSSSAICSPFLGVKLEGGGADGLSPTPRLGDDEDDEDDGEVAGARVKTGDPGAPFTTSASGSARHHSRKPKHLPCPDCGRVFTRHYNLQVHKLSHSGEKSHTCGFCPAAFARLHDLRRHVRCLHSRERPYPCPAPGCDEAYARADGLARHVRSEHPGFAVAGVAASA